MRDIFWTSGDCGTVCALEAEDEHALAAFKPSIAMQANMRSRTLRAYTASETDKGLAKLPHA